MASSFLFRLLTGTIVPFFLKDLFTLSSDVSPTVLLCCILGDKKDWSPGMLNVDLFFTKALNADFFLTS